MNITKLTHCYQLSLAEKSVTKTRNQVNLTRIASTLQQRSNNSLLASIGDFLNDTQNF